MAIYFNTSDKAKKVLIGKCVELRAGVGKAAGRLQELVMNVSVYNSESRQEESVKYTIPFWNNEQSSRADRLVKMKLKPDAIIAVLAYEDVDPSGKVIYNGIRVDYPGAKYELGTENPNTVLFGYAANPRKKENGPFSVSIAVNQYRDGGNATDWYGVSFFNGDDPSKPQRADNAEKVIRKGDLIAVIGGAVREKELNETVYRDITGFRFEIFKKETK